MVKNVHAVHSSMFSMQRVKSEGSGLDLAIYTTTPLLVDM